MREPEPLLALFEGQGYERVEPPILQDARIYLDLSGEEMRKSLLTLQGEEALCLRPELTIPLCRHYLQNQVSSLASSLACYALGPVFRKGEPESPQADIELIGRQDLEAADADILHLAVEACKVLGCSKVQVTIGDMGLLNGVMDQLDLAPALRRHVLRAIVSSRPMPEAVPETSSAYDGVLKALAGQDAGATRRLVEDILTIAGITSVGGRSAGDIAERFLAKSANPSGTLTPRQREVLERFLQVRGDPDMAAAQIRQLARETGLKLDAELERFEIRTGFMAASGLNVDDLIFTGAFARNFDYYTGLIFTISDAVNPAIKLASGGRYDDLLAKLGGAAQPAIGFALWIERFGDAS